MFGLTHPQKGPARFRHGLSAADGSSSAMKECVIELRSDQEQDTNAPKRFQAPFRTSKVFARPSSSSSLLCRSVAFLSRRNICVPQCPSIVSLRLMLALRLFWNWPVPNEIDLFNHLKGTNAQSVAKSRLAGVRRASACFQARASKQRLASTLPSRICDSIYSIAQHCAIDQRNVRSRSSAPSNRYCLFSQTARQLLGEATCRLVICFRAACALCFTRCRVSSSHHLDC